MMGIHQEVLARPTMEKTAQSLITIGETVWGPNWQAPMALALKMRDSKSIRDWLSGRNPIPPGIWKDLALICRERAQQMEALANLLGNITGGFQTQVGEMRPPAPRR